MNSFAHKVLFPVKWIALFILNTGFDIYLFLFHKTFYKISKITSHLTLNERFILYKLSKYSKAIAEIGSYIGASASCFGSALKASSTGTIICIDTWNNNAMSEGNRDTWAEFKTNTEFFNEYIKPIRGFSTDVVQSVRDISPKLDLLFIDGDHSYTGVKADWDSYRSFLTEGSIVVFHDYGWAEGVKQVVHEDVMPLVIKHGQLPNMWWGWIGRTP